MTKPNVEYLALRDKLRSQEARILELEARLKAADELATAAHEMSNGERDPEAAAYELNNAVFNYYNTEKG